MFDEGDYTDDLAWWEAIVQNLPYDMEWTQTLEEGDVLHVRDWATNDVYMTGTPQWRTRVHFEPSGFIVEGVGDSGGASIRDLRRKWINTLLDTILYAETGADNPAARDQVDGFSSPSEFWTFPNAQGQQPRRAYSDLPFLPDRAQGWRHSPE